MAALTISAAGIASEAASQVEEAPVAQILTDANSWEGGNQYSGRTVTASLKVSNNATATRTFWVRHSFVDKAGREYKQPAYPVRIPAGETSKTLTKNWKMPDPADPATLTTGPFTGKFTVYDRDPNADSTAVELDTAEKPGAFTVLGYIDQFASFDADRWAKGDHYLGGAPSTYLNPANLDAGTSEVANGSLKLRIPAEPYVDADGVEHPQGAEIRSVSQYRYGTYRARMKLADAPSAITGFFLYNGPDCGKEIDIEISNSGTDPKLMFGTYAEGRRTNEVVMPFPEDPDTGQPIDPTDGFHVYRFDYYPDDLHFYVDGVLMDVDPGSEAKGWSEGLPATGTFDNVACNDPQTATDDTIQVEDLKVNTYVNTWFPSWVEDKYQQGLTPRTLPETDLYTHVDYLQH